MMQPDESPVAFEKSIAKGKPQVFLLCCPGNIPFSFATHPWFVVNRGAALTRWEVLFRQSANQTSWGHLHKNFLPPFTGLGVLPYFENHFAYKATLIGYEENEVAEQMIEIIENSPKAYPFRNKFFLTGPNSNTYASWVLNQVPGSKLKLPWNAFGKGYLR